MMLPGQLSERVVNIPCLLHGSVKKQVCPSRDRVKCVVNFMGVFLTTPECVLVKKMVIPLHGGGASWVCTSEKQSTGIPVESLFESSFHVFCKRINDCTSVSD